MFDWQKMRELESTFGPSYYLLLVDKLRDNFRKIESAFKTRYSKFLIGYSYKTNYLPHLCKELNKMGAYAEVVSRLEYDLALKLGVNPKNIIYNGPIKTYEDIKISLDNESKLNIDSIYELENIKKYCLEHTEKLVKIGIRVNFDVSDEGNSVIQEGYSDSRFGICVENGDFHDVLDELKRIKNVKVVGIHSHFSTSTRNVETYGLITRKLCELAKTYIGDTIEYIDVGGGIYGELPATFAINAPTFEDYAEVICSVMSEEYTNEKHRPFLVLEPGMSMVANTFLFIAKVIEVKDVRSSKFVLVDGSVHNIKPTMHKRNLPMEVVAEGNREIDVYSVVGYTCMEKDYLVHEAHGILPQRNDYLIFENVGAYTIVFNPPFIRERPPIVALDGKHLFIVRKKETIKEFFNEDIYCF